MLKHLPEIRMQFSEWMLVLLGGILLFIYSLFHTEALKNILLLLAFVISITAFRSALLQKQNGLWKLVSVYGILQIWILFVALYIAKEPLLSLLEWKGQWLPASLSFVIGIAVAFTVMRSRFIKPFSAIALLIFIPITLFVIINNFVVIYGMLSSRAIVTHSSGITDHTANIGYLIALLEPILIADILYRVVKRSSLLPIPIWAYFLVMVLAIFALITASSRNGLLIMLLAFILATALMFSELRKTYPFKKVFAFLLMSLIFISGYVLISYKSDPRWLNFIETVPIAWDIDRDTLWLNSEGTNFPLTPDGTPVELSAYNRIAWAHEGWRMLIEHPWGIEVSRFTFRKLVLEKYGHAGMFHSHNSWLDFGLNVGVVGLILWATFLFLLLRKGWRVWQAQNEPLGLALMIMVIMFVIRGLFDSIFRDHIIGQFMLVAGLLIGALTFQQSDQTNNAPAK